MREANPDLVSDLGYAPYPTVNKGDVPRTTLGGMNYAISTYSQHPDEAFEAAMCMRNPENQLMAAIDAGTARCCARCSSSRRSRSPTRCTRRC